MISGNQDSVGGSYRKRGVEVSTTTHLTRKQEAFCLAIIAGSTASDAYRTAFQPPCASTKSINERASRLRMTSKIVARVAELEAPVVQEAQVSMAHRLKELENAVLLNPKECFDENGQPLSIRAMPDHVTRAIAGYEIDAEKFVTKVKFVDKLAATALYTKLLGDMPGDKRPPPAPPAKQYDPQQLTKEEWEEYKRIRRKALVGPVEGG